MLVVNAKLVAPALTCRLLPPLSCKISPAPESPDTVPPIVYVFVVHVIRTLVIFALVTAPLPLVSIQVCDGLEGCEATVTL